MLLAQGCLKEQYHKIKLNNYSCRLRQKEAWYLCHFVCCIKKTVIFCIHHKQHDGQSWAQAPTVASIRHRLKVLSPVALLLNSVPKLYFISEEKMYLVIKLVTEVLNSCRILAELIAAMNKSIASPPI